MLEFSTVLPALSLYLSMETVQVAPAPILSNKMKFFEWKSRW